MRALLVAPSMPMTYWSYQYSLPFIAKKASQIPLGMVTVAALLPSSWELRLIDLNVRPLRQRDLKWADTVLVGGMLAQLGSIEDVIARARAAGCCVVVGGPVTACPDRLQGADIVFQGEAEGRIDELVSAIVDADSNRAAGRLLSPEPGWHPPMDESPVPRFDLLEIRRYASAGVQFSRGCPFSCEFCDVIQLFGRRPRVKSVEQVRSELEALVECGYRGSLFFVDDNFIGNRRAVRDLLPGIASWQEDHGHPFDLYTEASLDLARDPELIGTMVDAGFSAVFVGLESPSPEALSESGKRQNEGVDMAEAIDTLTSAGLEVMGGFIVGFDADGPDVFEAQQQLIGSSPIPVAMVGVLSAVPGTALWRRLAGQHRLRGLPTGDQFGRPNFATSMDEVTLLEGYADLLARLYSPQEYYRRCTLYADRSGPSRGRASGWWADAMAGVRVVIRLGILGRRRLYFWRLMVHAARRGRRAVPRAVALAIRGEHLIRYTQQHVLPRIRQAVGELRAETGAAASS